MEITIRRHCVEHHPETGLSPLQQALLDASQKIRIAEAPTGAGKSYAFQRAMMDGDRVLFIVPTRRLAQNLLAGLAASLSRDCRWSNQAIEQKLAIWNSDETRRLKAAGEVNIGARRIREIYDLNQAIEGGEMIISVPEVLSYLLLRNRPGQGQSDTGIFEVLNNFEHIVFDEFHTISPRGFGLAALFSKLAAEWNCRAKVTFLSATPLDISPVLKKLDVPEEQIVHLHDRIVSEGRAVHGDVRLTFHSGGGMPELVAELMPEILEQIRKGRQAVVIYNALADLQKDLSRIETLFRSNGIEPRRALVIDSIDDSRVHADPNGFFAAGREQDPEAFDILIATASVEMGVTFHADLLIMEPGFEGMNFLQRYGRAARGDHDGHVAVRYDDRPPAWFRSLEKWARKRSGGTAEIRELTEVLTQSYRKRFEYRGEERVSYFGRLPNRAAYAAGLYWNLLMDHFSNRGHRWQHLKAHQPGPARKVFGLLRSVREMEKDPVFGHAAKDWCDRFKQECKTLRDIGRGVRVVEDNGGTFYAQEIWLQRNTDILFRFPLTVSEEDGVEEVRINGTLQSYLTDDRPFIPAVCNARFPHTDYTLLIKEDALLVSNWMRELKREPLSWELYPASMAAAQKLVLLTGLVVRDETGVEASSGVL